EMTRPSKVMPRSVAACAAASLRPLKYSLASGTKYANVEGTGGFWPTVSLGTKGWKSLSEVEVLGVPKSPPAAADAPGASDWAATPTVDAAISAGSDTTPAVAAALRPRN